MANSSWLPRALEESRARGFLGPSEIQLQITHAEGFAHCWHEHFKEAPTSFLDLGSGGGLPGLVLLERWRCRALLLDSMVKRTVFLREVLCWPGAPISGEVVLGRAEEYARTLDATESFDLVTARSFGPPAVTVECGVRFLKVGGLLVVSEPPLDDDGQRWDDAGLRELRMKSLGRVRHGAAYQILQKTAPTPGAYPRTIGTPTKHPLF